MEAILMYVHLIKHKNTSNMDLKNPTLSLSLSWMRLRNKFNVQPETYGTGYHIIVPIYCCILITEEYHKYEIYISQKATVTKKRRNYLSHYHKPSNEFLR